MSTAAAMAASVRQYRLVSCGEPLQLAHVPRPALRGAEVLVAVDACGVCHTDLHLSDGYFDLGGGKRVNLSDRGIRLPHTLGHEIAGRVVDTGPQAAHLQRDSRVLVYPWIGCGECAVCAKGDGHLCAAPRSLGVFRPGGFASHVVVSDPKYLFALGKLAPHAAAPLACSGLTAFSALRKATAIRGPIGLIGAGGLGLMALALLRMQGGRGAHVIEPHPGKRAAARELGALGAWDTTDEDMRALQGASGAGLEAVIDFVGSPESLARGIDLLAKGGKLIVVGMFGGEATLPIPLLVLRALSIEGSYVGSLAEMAQLMDLVNAAGSPQLPIEIRPLEQVNEAIAAMRAGQVIGRMVLKPAEGDAR